MKLVRRKSLTPSKSTKKVTVDLEEIPDMQKQHCMEMLARQRELQFKRDPITGDYIVNVRFVKDKSLTPSKKLKATPSKANILSSSNLRSASQKKLLDLYHQQHFQDVTPRLGPIQPSQQPSAVPTLPKSKSSKSIKKRKRKIPVHFGVPRRNDSDNDGDSTPANNRRDSIDSLEGKRILGYGIEEGPNGGYGHIDREGEYVQKRFEAIEIFAQGFEYVNIMDRRYIPRLKTLSTLF